MLFPQLLRVAYASELMSLNDICLLFFTVSKGNVIAHIVNFGMY